VTLADVLVAKAKEAYHIQQVHFALKPGGNHAQNNDLPDDPIRTAAGDHGKPAFAITQANKIRYSRGALIFSGGSEAYQYDQLATRQK